MNQMIAELGSEMVISLIGLATAISTLLGIALGKGWISGFHRWVTRGRVLDGIESLRDTYLALAAMNTLGSQRTIMFAGHNAGGVPRPGCNFFVSAIHWVPTGKDDPQKFLDYRNIPVDAEYISMLLDTERNGHAVLRVAEMPSSLLKSYYLAEGVTESVVFFISVSEKKFIFVSTAKFDGEFSDDEITKIKLKCNVIKNIIS